MPVFAVRPDIALEDRAPYELIRMLREAGWTWSILPRTVQARKPLQYQRGSAQVWYSVSTAVVPDYLRCLLMSEELFDQGLDAVPHYRRKVDDYRRLLYEGARLADLPAIEDSKKRPRPEVLEDEVDAPVEELDPFVDSDLENDMQALIDAEYAAACELEQLEPPPEDSPAPGGTTYCFPIEDVVPVELPDPTFPPALALPDVPPPPLAPPALQDDPQHQERRGKKKAFIQEWGNGFTMRWSGKASIEMECLWHLKSAKTGCKNTCSVNVGGDDAVDIVKKALKWWANQAREYTRQEDHVGCLKNVLGVPIYPDAFLEAGQITAEHPSREQLLAELLPGPPPPHSKRRRRRRPDSDSA